jgi:uncharacterized protein (DUF4415 family)
MSNLSFEWDSKKAASNAAKHGVRGALPAEARLDDPDYLSSAGWHEGETTISSEATMRSEYDFSKAKKNPYAKRLKKTVTIRLEDEIISYFKAMSADTGVPYQNLINLYLRDCAQTQKRLSLDWRPHKVA